MKAPALITRRSLDQLEADIISLSTHINAQEYEFLVLLREFDLPQISLAFQKGDLSYSKARALSRVATPRNEEHLLDFAIRATAAHVDRHCRELRNVQRQVSTADANHLHENRYLSCTPHGDGSVTLSVALPKESADLVMKALERAVAAIIEPDAEYFNEYEALAGLEAGTQAGKGGNGGNDGNKKLSEIDGDASRDASGLFKRQADALVEIARSYLAGGKESKSCTADHYQVAVHVDEKALRGKPDGESKSDLPIETVRRLCCDGAIVPIIEDSSGKLLNLGRKHRVVQPALKRALLARDKQCRFPGCTHEKWLDGHHVVHWADGGETSLDNTILLCSKHHRLLHEGGFEIKAGARGEWQFRNASGMRQ
jgi:hypothetical protein